MKDAIPRKEMEDSLRCHGLEGEDAFHVVAAYYVQYYNGRLNGKALRATEDAKAKICLFERDLRLFMLLEQTVSSDPHGLNLPIWYQHFMGRRFRLETGKFFTPRPIASAMASLLPRKEDAIIMDPTCGGGTFLVEASKRWEGLSCRLIGNDVDSVLVELTDIVLSIGASPNHERSLFSCNIYDVCNEFRALYGTVDFVLANPPFSLRIGSIPVRSKLFVLGYRTSDALFIDLAFQLLKPSGRLVCLLPHALIVNREYARFRLAVEEDWSVVGVITLPEGVFHLTANTTTRADILVLDKRGEKEQDTSRAVFCHAPSVGMPLNSRKTSDHDNALDEILGSPDVQAAFGIA